MLGLGLFALAACDDGADPLPTEPTPADAAVDAATGGGTPPRSFDRAARACEVTFSDPTGAVEVTFGPGVRGRTLTQKPRTAVAFIATANQPFGPNALTVDRPVEVISSRCYDAAGRLLPDARVEL